MYMFDVKWAGTEHGRSYLLTASLTAVPLQRSFTVNLCNVNHTTVVNGRKSTMFSTSCKRHRANEVFARGFGKSGLSSGSILVLALGTLITTLHYISLGTQI